MEIGESMKTPEAMMTRLQMAERFRNRLNESRISNKELAHELGYLPNMISMMKSGATRIPGGAVPKLAALFGEDPKHMAMEWLCFYIPEIAKSLGADPDLVRNTPDP